MYSTKHVVARARKGPLSPVGHFVLDLTKNLHCRAEKPCVGATDAQECIKLDVQSSRVLVMERQKLRKERHVTLAVTWKLRP
ncbi:hypothetical protein DPMN_013052 [Dreissena polymorpha]|uniref:Uncharacterized protein n=1 Tax=Dreissena polymorpha TaxID=45954 RepID=A0A9D4S218_DREPO|nr:hypothetical protein DPMN_013052 [Dreissena polymorpha]